MMYQATKEIRKVFEEKGLKFEKFETEDSSAIQLTFNGHNVEGAKIRFFSTDNEADVAMFAFNIIHCPVGGEFKLLTTLNQLNKHYRYVKFYLDAENDVCVSFDLLLATPNVGYACYEIAMRAMRVIDAAYPVIREGISGE